MKRILVLDGGGCKGLIEAAILREMEYTLSASIYRKVDLIVTTSVGAVIGGILATGTVMADFLLNKMVEAVVKVFSLRLRIPILQPKYDRTVLSDMMDKYVHGLTMNQCKTKFLCTSVNMVDGRTHYFKSWEEKDGKENLIQVINRSYAAPLYFGEIVDNKKGAIWLDGGTGNMNCPLMQAYIEIIRQCWENEPVHILSLGTGYPNISVPFKNGMWYKNLRQILYFMKPVDGGLARMQEPKTQVEFITNLTKISPNITMQRIDKEIPKKLDKMDAAKYRDQYVKIGVELSKKIDYDPFM